MAEKKEGFREVERHYELDMYKLVAVAAIIVLISVGLGAFLGTKIGHASGVNSVEVTVPEYCHVEGSGDELNVECGTELEETTLDELCGVLSTSLKQNLKVLLVN